MQPDIGCQKAFRSFSGSLKVMAVEGGSGTSLEGRHFPSADSSWWVFGEVESGREPS